MREAMFMVVVVKFFFGHLVEMVFFVFVHCFIMFVTVTVTVTIGHQFVRYSERCVNKENASEGGEEGGLEMMVVRFKEFRNEVACREVEEVAGCNTGNNPDVSFSNFSENCHNEHTEEYTRR